MPQSACWDTIEAVVRQCAVDLFGHYGVDLSPQPPTDHPIPATMAFIGYSGDELRGALALAVDTAVVRRSNTLLSEPHPDHDADWTGELANQLLGRIQNRLRGHGASIRIGTPLVLTGTDVRVFAADCAHHLHHAFGAREGAVQVWFDGELRPGFRLSPASDHTETSEAEGSMLLF